MSIKDEYQKLIEERKKIVEIVDWNEPVIKKMIALFTKDINETIKFVLEDCSEDQFSWLSEIFDQIVQKTKSKEFIEALRKIALKYPEETEDYNIIFFIDFAESFLDD